jgi:hypothetical protein
MVLTRATLETLRCASAPLADDGATTFSLSSLPHLDLLQSQPLDQHVKIYMEKGNEIEDPMRSFVDIATIALQGKWKYG